MIAGEILLGRPATKICLFVIEIVARPHVVLLIAVLDAQSGLAGERADSRTTDALFSSGFGQFMEG